MRLGKRSLGLIDLGNNRRAGCRKARPGFQLFAWTIPLSLVASSANATVKPFCGFGECGADDPLHEPCKGTDQEMQRAPGRDGREPPKTPWNYGSDPERVSGGPVILSELIPFELIPFELIHSESGLCVTYSFHMEPLQTPWKCSLDPGPVVS